MNIAVLVKHVPDTAEADIVVAPDGRTIKAAGLPYQLNEWDRFALEEAVQLKDATQGRLTAFLLGAEDAEESLRRCLAVGADRAVRIEADAAALGDPSAVARRIGAAMGDEAFDLVLCGAQAADDGFGLVGPMLAEQLKLPSAALVNDLEHSEGRLRCTRELEGGWGEVLELDLPCLVTIQTGINEPRYVSILGIRKARQKPIDVVAPADPGHGESRSTAELLTLESLEVPPPGGEAELWEGTPDQVAERFVAVLKEKGGVL